MWCEQSRSSILIGAISLRRWRLFAVLLPPRLYTGGRLIQLAQHNHLLLFSSCISHREFPLSPALHDVVHRGAHLPPTDICLYLFPWYLSKPPTENPIIRERTLVSISTRIRTSRKFSLSLFFKPTTDYYFNHFCFR